MAVVLDHAVGIDAEARSCPRDSGLQVGVDVHAGRVEPDEERLLVLRWRVDELEVGVEHLLVDRLHPLLGERAGVLAALLAPLPEAAVVAGVSVAVA